MARLSTKALSGIEKRLDEVDEGSIRHKILTSAKNFKISWIELGQSLYSVWKDKLYREWGYITFEAYTSKEIGVRKATALKLLKSYYFLEREEPAYLQKEQSAEPTEVASVPSYESVNLLRLAKGRKGLDEEAYRSLKKDVFESGKDTSDVRKSLTGLIREREELDPEEARRTKRVSVLKRFLSNLRALKTDIESSKMLPSAILKDTTALIAKIEAAIE